MSSTIQSSAELYDLSRDTSTMAPGGMTVGRQWHTSTLLNNGLVLITGGMTSSGATGSAELFDPGTGFFTYAGSMSIARSHHNATLLTSGDVLITGDATAAAEVYQSSSFSTVGSMTTIRQNCSATQLLSGQVLLAGGIADMVVGLPLKTAELYDPFDKTFTPTGPMNLGRCFHTAALLDDGKVLVAGGWEAVSMGATASAELYIPYLKSSVVENSYNESAMSFSLCP
jgi:hypothetical protein